MGTLKKRRGHTKVELVRLGSKDSFVLKSYSYEDYPYTTEEEASSIFYIEDRPVFFHLPLKYNSEEIIKIKKIINGHAFQGGIKNSFHVVRKKENQNLNSTINQRRGSLLKESIREAFIPFSEMEHKNQLVRVIGGIKFIDDSSSVNVNAAWFSLEIHDAPIVWIMGGLDFRNNDYQIIFDLVKEKVKALVFLGKKPDKVDQIFGKIVPCIFHKESMKEAVEISYRLAIPGDTVLLSPACSSLDMFENFEDRGNQFRKYILALE